MITVKWPWAALWILWGISTLIGMLEWRTEMARHSMTNMLITGGVYCILNQKKNA